MNLEVMIVDDDPVFTKIAGLMLKMAGFNQLQHTCHNGQDALEILVQRSSMELAFLIFLDINMPVLDGWGVLDALKDYPYKKNIYVVMATSSIAQTDKDRASAYDCVISYLIKPLRREDLSVLLKSEPVAVFNN
ncbi:MAG: response regulator [Niabella sp.]|nr:response regulator [Niabella sp.]